MTDNKTKRVTFWTTPKMKERIKEVAQKNGMNQSDLARLGTMKMIENLEGEIKDF